MSEISRVLGPGGKCLITFFLLNDESKNLILSHRSALNFSHRVQDHPAQDCLVKDMDDPEAAVAYGDDFVLRLFKKYGLEFSQPIQYGSWCGRDVFLTYQDVIIATKLGNKTQVEREEPRQLASFVQTDGACLGGERNSDGGKPGRGPESK